MAGQGYQFIEMALRKQQQQAQLDYQAERDRRKDIQAALGQVADAASFVGKGMAQKKQDDIANTLMNESSPPRAEAVDPLLNEAMKTAGLGATRPATGGMDEMKMRMALQDREDRQEDREFNRGMAVTRENRMAQALEERQAALDQRAIQAAQATDDKTKQFTTSAGAFFDQETALQNRMKSARTEDEFNGYANQLKAAYVGAKSAGVKLPDDYAIPSWQDAAETRAAEQLKQSEISSLEKSIATGGEYWGPDALKGLGFMPNRKTKLDTLKGDAAPARRESPEAPAENAIPAGKTAVNPQTGQRIRWNGQTWEPAP